MSSRPSEASPFDSLTLAQARLRDLSGVQQLGPTERLQVAETDETESWLAALGIRREILRDLSASSLALGRSR